MDYGTCRSCRVQVLWARSASTGKPMPLDAEGDEERGNVLVDGQGRAHVFRNAQVAAAYQEEHPEADVATSSRYMAHHATCPNRERHRGNARQESLL
jgi:hypothetical protein